jgi:hypothetical protein
MTPDSIPEHVQDERVFPSWAQIAFIEEILAWTLRTETLSEAYFSMILDILRHDATITPLVPFLVTSIESAAVQMYIPGQRIRMMRLTEAWVRNPRTHPVVRKAYIPRLIAACSRIIERGEVDDPAEMEQMHGLVRFLYGLHVIPPSSSLSS